jgi:hypothetical protein
LYVRNSGSLASAFLDSDSGVAMNVADRDRGESVPGVVVDDDGAAMGETGSLATVPAASRAGTADATRAAEETQTQTQRRR